MQTQWDKARQGIHGTLDRRILADNRSRRAHRLPALTSEYVDRDPDDSTTDNYWLGRGYVTVVPTGVDMTADCKDIACLREL